MGPVEFQQSAAQRLTGHYLIFRIESGADRQAAVVEAVLAVELHHLAAHFLGERFRRKQPRARRLGGYGEGLGAIALLLLSGDIAVLGHAAQNPIAPLDRLGALLEGMIIVRSLRQS